MRQDIRQPSWKDHLEEAIGIIGGITVYFLSAPNLTEEVQKILTDLQLPI